MLNEANRPDRENYVDIEWDHIRPDDMFNFAKHSSDYFDPHGIPYDYGSIMHMAPDVSGMECGNECFDLLIIFQGLLAPLAQNFIIS